MKRAELVVIVSARRQVLNIVEELGTTEHHVEVARVDELRVEGVAFYEVKPQRRQRYMSALYINCI